MPKSRERKQEIINQLKEGLSKASAAILVDYKGITVEEDTRLRKLCRDAGVEYKVVKNTLLELAAKETGYDAIIPYLTGSTAIAIGYGDPVAPAKALTEFINGNNKLSIKAGMLGGTKLMKPSDIEALAKLPPKEVLVARLLGQLNAPMSGLVNVMQGTIRKLVYALDAIKETKTA